MPLALHAPHGLISKTLPLGPPPLQVKRYLRSIGLLAARKRGKK